MSKDPMVGAIEGMEYHEEKLQLEKNDALILFTDGVTEAMSTSFEEYGEERLVNVLQGVPSQNCRDIINAVIADVSSFTQDAEQSDDITMLTIKKL